MSIYKVLNKASNVEAFAISLRKMGYTAYVEVEDGVVFLVTNYQVTGMGFLYIGERS